MASIREQIMQAVIAELNVSVPTGIPQATRMRVTAYEPDELPAITVYPEREEVSNINGRWGQVVQRTMSIRVDCRAIGGDDALDPLIVHVVGMLAGTTLGGLVQDIQERMTDWQFDEADALYGLASVGFEIRYTTSVVNLESKT